FRRGRRRLVRAPTENGGERLAARVAALRAVEGGARGCPAPHPRPNPPRRGIVAGGHRANRRRLTHGERLMARRPIATVHPDVGEPMVRKKTTSELRSEERRVGKEWRARGWSS